MKCVRVGAASRQSDVCGEIRAPDAVPLFLQLRVKLNKEERKPLLMNDTSDYYSGDDDHMQLSTNLHRQNIHITRN